MGLATDNAPARPEAPSPYSLWEIDVRLFDERMKQIDAFSCRQELLVTEDRFIVRLTRHAYAGAGKQYEARGELRGAEIVNGASGFGGALTGRLLANGGVFLEGQGGDVDFILIATPTGPDHQRCFRRFVVRNPTRLWGTPVSKGVYFVTTEDQMTGSAAEAPAELLRPLTA